MDRMLEFTGHFHPLLVHLPIGFLLIAVVFIWMKEPGRAVKISIALGALAAIASVITGLILASSEGYGDEVTSHKVSGIVLAIVSVAMWFIPERFLKPGSVVMTAMIILTGHYGGTLTHGPLIADPEVDNLDLSKVDIANAVFYNDAVQPILEARCYTCHGEGKQKGGLRLDTQQAIAKGGKDGKIIEPGNPEESELVKRLDLPLDDEDHMPPKEKRQLTEQEKRLISLWVASGSDFTKKMSESLSKEQLSELLTTKSNAIELPDVEVGEADHEAMAKLTELNVSVAPVAKGSNFLQVSFITVPDEAPQLLENLKPVAKNIVSLKLSKANVDDQGMKILSSLENLTTLNLSDTKITDAAIDEIIKCKLLVSLNLSGTKVTTEGVKKLTACENLRYLNVYKTSVADVDLPGVTIEKGNYSVPTFESDTTRVK